MSNTQVKKIKGFDSTFATMSISVLDIKNKTIKTIIKSPNTFLDAGYIYSNPSFSPDGKFIVYQHSGSDVSGGFSVINLKGRTIFRYPKKATDSTPYWRPQFTSDGKGILCYSPATNEKEKDLIFLIDIKSGAKRMITEGSNPTFVCEGKVIIFERWVDKWSPEGGAKSDLWLLELNDGAEPELIKKNAHSASGSLFCSKRGNS